MTWELIARTLNLGLDSVDGVRRLHLKGDSLPREGLDEDLHLDEGLRYNSQYLIFTFLVKSDMSSPGSAQVPHDE